MSNCNLTYSGYGIYPFYNSFGNIKIRSLNNGYKKFYIDYEKEGGDKIKVIKNIL